MVNKRRCNDFICASLSLLIILLSEYYLNLLRYYSKKLSCADAVDFLTKSLGMPYSVVTAQQACSTEMVNTGFFSYTLNTSTRNRIGRICHVSPVDIIVIDGRR